MVELRRLLGPRLTKNIYASSVQTAIDHGAEINGASDKEWTMLRKIAAAAQAASTAGTSMRAILLLHGDPTWKPAVAPALKWHKEIWAADASNR